jgi:hypothetical protein
VNYKDHPQSIASKRKDVHFTPEMHQKLIDKGVGVIEEVSLSLDVAYKPYTTLGMFKEFAPKNFRVKVKCFYCRDLKNLEWNLLHHLASTKHLGQLKHPRLAQDAQLQFSMEGKGGKLNHLELVYILTNLILEDNFL